MDLGARASPIQRKYDPEMTVAVSFPDSLPRGYEWFENEPIFDPNLHLQLEHPADIVMLDDLGYSAKEIATKAKPGWLPPHPSGC